MHTPQEHMDIFSAKIKRLHERFLASGKDYILIANIPAAAQNEQDGPDYVRLFHMADVHMLYQSAANTYCFSFISMYELFSAYLAQNEQALLHTRLGLFFCCGFLEQQEMQRQNLFPKPMQEHAFAQACFGGKLQPKSLGEKLAVRMITSAVKEDGPPIPEVDEQAIAQFAQTVKNA